MRVLVHKLRDKYTWWLLLLFAPLEVIAFLCPPDSVIGKALLIIKCAIMGVLYMFHADKQKLVIHLLLLISFVSIAISTFEHGGVGTSLLILMMFFAMVTLPNIEIDVSKLCFLYTLLALCGTAVIIYGIVVNYREGISAFQWTGIFNPNTFGMILLSVFFYLESGFGTNRNNMEYYIKIALVFPFAFLIIMTGCRSAIISLAFLLLTYVVLKKSNYRRLIYYVIVVMCIIVPIGAIFIMQRTDIMTILSETKIFGKAIFSGREKIWSEVFSGFIQSPILGQSSEYLLKNTGYSSAHNVFFGILGAVGFFPGFMYIMILLSPIALLHLKRENSFDTMEINKLCFVASLVISIFECVYTDNRLNLLFLPLLISKKDNVIIPNYEVNGNNNEENKTTQKMKNGTLRNSKVTAFALSAVLLITYLLEPVVINNTRNTFPSLMDEVFWEMNGYEIKDMNLLDDTEYISGNIAGVKWDWTGDMYRIQGIASNITSNLTLYSSSDTLPAWVLPGKQYRLFFESENVRFRIYYYSEDGGFGRFLDTQTSGIFTIPTTAVGLIIRLSVDEGVAVKETVTPVICPLP